MWQRITELVVITLLVCLLSPTDAEGEKSLTVDTLRARSIEVGEQLTVRTRHENGDVGIVRIYQGKIQVWREPKGEKGLGSSNCSTSVLSQGLLIASNYKVGLDLKRVRTDSAMFVSSTGLDVHSDSAGAKLTVGDEKSALELRGPGNSGEIYMWSKVGKAGRLDEVAVHVIGSPDSNGRVAETTLTDEGLTKSRR